MLTIDMPVPRKRNAKNRKRQNRSRPLKERLLDQLDYLPGLPSTVTDLLKLDATRNSFFDEIKQTVEREPGYTARLLSIANSASNAPVHPITRVQDAIARIGPQHICGLLISMAVVQIFVPRNDWERSLWRHTLQVATAARTIAKLAPGSKLDPEEVYVCGLMHDIGRFIFLLEAPEVAKRVDEGNWSNPETLIELERSICGLTHAELGALACEQWGMSSTVIAAARTHHDPQDLTKNQDKIDRVNQLMHLCDLAMFPSAVPGTPGLAEAEQDEVYETLGPLLPKWLSWSPAVLHQTTKQITSESNAVCLSMGI